MKLEKARWSKSCFLIKLPPGTNAISLPRIVYVVLAKSSSFCSYGKFLNLPRFFGLKSHYTRSSRYTLLYYKHMGNFLLRFLNDGFSQHATFAYPTFSDWFYYFFILLKNLQKLYKIPQKKTGRGSLGPPTVWTTPKSAQHPWFLNTPIAFRFMITIFGKFVEYKIWSLQYVINQSINQKSLDYVKISLFDLLILNKLFLLAFS